MGSDAILAYGYDLGGGEGSWRVAQLDEYGDLDVPWCDSGNDDEFLEEAERLLRVDGALADVQITMYGHRDDNDTSYMLTAKVINSDWENPPVALDPATLTRREDLEVWDRHLADALETLGLAPFQDRPRWMLQSFTT